MQINTRYSSCKYRADLSPFLKQTTNKKSYSRINSRTKLNVLNNKTREEKNVIIESLKSNLQDSLLVFGMEMKGVTVEQLDKLRRSVPKDSTKIIVCKNSYLIQAIDRIEGWENLKDIAKGQNAWIFASESGISKAVSAWIDFERVEYEMLEAGAEKGVTPEHMTNIKGGVMEGKFLSHEEVEKLKDLPTKEELYAKLAMMIKDIPKRMAVAIKKVPQNVALSIKAISELDENKELLVGNFVKK